jgi:lysine 2,3-aminomutase
MDKLRGHISGLAVPQFVIDAPGGGGKIPLLPEYVLARDKEKIILRNFKNEVYEYPDVQEDHPLLKKGRSIERRYTKKRQKKVTIPVLQD